MRAAKLVAPGQVTIVDDWPEARCGPHDAVVQIPAVGLCGSDHPQDFAATLEAIAAGRPAPEQSVPGMFRWSRLPPRWASVGEIPGTSCLMSLEPARRVQPNGGCTVSTARGRNDLRLCVLGTRTRDVTPPAEPAPAEEATQR